jgi:tRNA(fMet)-specific endonuclease VapC
VRYLLDTNICIYIANHRPSAVLERFQALRPGDVGMSAITYAELVYGAEKSRRVADNLDRLERLRTGIAVLDLTDSSARASGKLRAQLEQKGRTIGAYDLLIAGHALSLGVILVTNNTKEFSRVRGLKLENWVA